MIKLKETNSDSYTNEIIHLYNDCFSKGISQQHIDQTELQQYIAFILKNGSTLIATENEILAGALLSFPMSLEAEIPDIIKSEFEIDKSIYIAELMVNEEYRGQGIGRNLMNCFLNSLDKSLYSDVLIRVWELNLPALGLYEKLGFSPVASLIQTKRKAGDNGTFEMKKLYLHKKIF